MRYIFFSCREEKQLNKVLMAALIMLVAGCTSIAYKPAKDARYERTQQVDVLYDAPSRPFEVTGRLEWHGIADKVADVLVEMIESAKSVGADALIVRETTWKDTSHLIAVMGQTIKYSLGEEMKQKAPESGSAEDLLKVKSAAPVEAQPAAPTGTQPPAQTEVQPEVQTEVQPIAQPAVPEVQPEIQAQPEVQPMTQPEVSVEVRPEGRSTSK